MTPLQIALATVFAGLAGLLAGVAADDRLLTADDAVNGGPLVITAPRELLGLTVAAAAVVAGAVFSGYGLLARLRRPA